MRRTCYNAWFDKSDVTIRPMWCHMPCSDNALRDTTWRDLTGVTSRHARRHIVARRCRSSSRHILEEYRWLLTDRPACYIHTVIRRYYCRPFIDGSLRLLSSWEAPLALDSWRRFDSLAPPASGSRAWRRVSHEGRAGQSWRGEILVVQRGGFMREKSKADYP